MAVATAMLARRTGALVTRMIRVASALFSLGGCGGPQWEGWTETTAYVPAPEAEHDDQVLPLGPMVLRAPEASEPFAVLDADGTLHRRDCERVIGTDGTVRDPASEAVVLQVDGDGRVLDADGEVRFRLDGQRLVREDGRAVSIGEGAVRFEESPALTLAVEGASERGLQRTALVALAAIALCQP